MAKTAKKDPFRETLNLPQTDFAMRANLVENEPKIQARWENIKLEERIAQMGAPAGDYVFHDGPPYANGAIHLGHLLNKTLKDLVVRSRRASGHRVRFVPGWDCHGLPIEHKVMKDLGPKARSMSTSEVRNHCRRYAEKYIDLQRGQMKRLGTSAQYDDPYLTMAPAYEGAVLDVFAELVRKGLAYRSLKPVHWSIANRTALADAELEYQDREDTSVFVFFEIEGALPANLGSADKARLMIWTTTPWTLPANRAVAVQPNADYHLVAFSSGGKEHAVILGDGLHEQVLKQGDVTEFEIKASCTGQDLVDAKLTYRHPFIDRVNPVVGADYVTLDDGTGLVHTAPGHGEDDYVTGLREGIDVYCPVQGDGTYDETAPEWLRGIDVWKANDLITEHLRESGHLFLSNTFTHSYPHDWRSKTPTIFRATDQWFIAVDQAFGREERDLRTRALDAADQDIAFIPDWGQKRLRGMLDARPDWCISRQRAWGLPIPAMLKDDDVLLTPTLSQHFADLMREHGSEIWFDWSVSKLLEGYNVAADGDAPDWAQKLGSKLADAVTPSRDIFDVWFESGSSWNAVLRTRSIGYPADLYLEGSDQHRGWFQLSLLPALGVTGEPPFKTLLTHGFMVDAKGHKMSKSLGNTVDVDDLLNKYGADIARWWVCSLNYANDIKVDWSFFKTASDEYRKVRNTLRFLMGNLGDFDPNKDAVTFENKDAQSVDAWARQELQRVTTEVRRAYDKLEFRIVRETLFNYCNDSLSAIYLSATKDRLYCDAPDSRRRRRTQTVMFEIADAMIRMLAPVLVHTADEAYLALHRLDAESEASVHLCPFPTAGAPSDAGAWADVMTLRDEVLKEVETKREQDGLGSALEAGVRIVRPNDTVKQLQPYEAELADLCGVSRLSFSVGDSASITVDDLREEPRCARSWKRDGTVQERANGALLSDRDAEVIGVG